MKHAAAVKVAALHAHDVAVGKKAVVVATAVLVDNVTKSPVAVALPVVAAVVGIAVAVVTVLGAADILRTVAGVLVG